MVSVLSSWYKLEWYSIRNIISRQLEREHMQKLEDEVKVAGKCDSIAPKMQKHAAMPRGFSDVSQGDVGPRVSALWLGINVLKLDLEKQWLRCVFSDVSQGDSPWLTSENMHCNHCFSQSSVHPDLRQRIHAITTAFLGRVSGHWCQIRVHNFMRWLSTSLSTFLIKRNWNCGFPTNWKQNFR
jgi:hypothetical protein